MKKPGTNVDRGRLGTGWVVVYKQSGSEWLGGNSHQGSRDQEKVISEQADLGESDWGDIDKNITLWMKSLIMF